MNLKKRMQYTQHDNAYIQTITETGYEVSKDKSRTLEGYAHIPIKTQLCSTNHAPRKTEIYVFYKSRGQKVDHLTDSMFEDRNGLLFYQLRLYVTGSH